MITAMTEFVFILIATLVVAAMIGTIVVTLREVLSDGSRHPRAPRSHVPDPFDPRVQRLV